MIDWKFWLFLIVFALSQCLIALSLNVRLSNEAMTILNQLSAQVACMAGDDEFCKLIGE